MVYQDLKVLAECYANAVRKRSTIPMGLGDCVSCLFQLTRAKISLPKSSCLYEMRMLSMVDRIPLLQTES